MSSKLKCRTAQQQGRAAIIGLVLSSAIVLILGAWMYPRMMNTGGGITEDSGGAYTSALQKANGIACGSYYSQIKMAISEYRRQYGVLPPDLRSLSSEGVTADMWNDPDCKFSYNAATGGLGDVDTPMPTTPQYGAWGYARQQPAAPNAGGPQPNTDIYSKAAHAGEGGDINGYMGGSGGN